MSRETESALTPEEWRQRGFVAPWPANGVEAHGYDGELEGRDCPTVYVRGNGSMGVDNTAGEYGCGELDARKVMALANLSLTLEQKPAAFTQADVEMCVAAAWYFRRNVAGSAAKEGTALKDAAELAARTATALANKLRALVPPQ